MKQEKSTARWTRNLLAVFLMVLACVAAARAQTTAFTYQGRLSDGMNAASGSFDMQFRLFDTAMPGTGMQSGGVLTFSVATGNAVNVAGGVFTVQLDFGANPFAAGVNRFLEIAVKRPADAEYTILTPRQPLTSSPFAIRTLSANSADGLSSLCVGCVTNANINSVGGGKVTGTVAAATNATNAAQLGGVAANQYLRTTDASTGFIQNTTTTQTGNFNISGVGVIGGNLNVGGTLRGNGSGLTNINATVADGSITAAKLAPNVIFNPKRVALLQWYDANRSIAPIAVNVGPRGLAFDGTFMYVASGTSNTVTRIQASTGVVEGSPISVGNFPIALTFDGTFVYVATINSDGVTRIRASTGMVEPGGAIVVGDDPRALAFDGTFVYAANFGSNNVTRIRASTGVVEGTPIPVGSSAQALAFDGTFMYVANAVSNNVTRIRASTGVVEGTPIPVGALPVAIAFDGTFMYVTNVGDHNVTRF